MKQKLTIPMDAELLPIAKRYARARGVSLSSLIEQSLREVVGEQASSFAARWRGQFGQPSATTRVTKRWCKSTSDDTSGHRCARRPRPR